MQVVVSRTADDEYRAENYDGIINIKKKNWNQLKLNIKL
jgi:hypothetical protein